MDRPIAVIVDRVERSRAARAARENVAAVGGRAAATSTTNALPIGARVFDRVTGLEGEVVYGTRESVVVKAAER